MLSTIGLWGMAVGAILIFVDRDPFYLWAKKPVPVVETESAVNVKDEDKRLDAIIEITRSLVSSADENRQANREIVAALKFNNEQIDNKLKYYDQALKNQKPPVIHMPEIKFPEKLKVEMVQPVEIKGSLDLQTPEGKRLRVLHQPGKSRPPGLKAVGVGNAPATFESVKKQIDGLSK